jgi:hypothetical protein
VNGTAIAATIGEGNNIVRKSHFTWWPLLMLPGLFFTWNVTSARGISPQDMETIDAGTTIQVRTNGRITADAVDGRVFTGVVAQDIRNDNDRIAIPKGSDVELIVRRTSPDEFVLDIDSMTVNGQRYAQRSLKSTSTEAALGLIVAVIAGKGANGVAPGGVGAQILTQGRMVDVPDDSLLTFVLKQPFRAGVPDNGFMIAGNHYHQYNNDQSIAGMRQKPSHYSDGRGNVSIGSDKYISWTGPDNSVVYIQVDDEVPTFFASGPVGTQGAPWMSEGHVYTFILMDARGNEIAHDQKDLRP